MDKFEEILKADAREIDAAVSPELGARIKASLHCAVRLKSESKAPQSREPASKPGGNNGVTASLWWASSLTGLAAAVVVITVLNLQQPAHEAGSIESVATEVVPDAREYLLRLQQQLPLRVETAVFTSSLEEELSALEADFRKAKANVNRDLDFTF